MQYKIHHKKSIVNNIVHANLGYEAFLINRAIKYYYTKELALNIMISVNRLALIILSKNRFLPTKYTISEINEANSNNYIHHIEHIGSKYHLYLANISDVIV